MVRNYDPVSFYACNNIDVRINNFSDYSKVNIVLSTNHGKHKTVKERKYWSPVSELLHKGTAVQAQAIRNMHKFPNIEKSIFIPNGAKYAITYTKNNKENYDFIFEMDFTWLNKNNVYKLEKEHFDNIELLSQHLKKLTSLEKLHGIDISTIEVYSCEDLPAIIERKRFYNEKETFEQFSWFDINVLSRLNHKYEDFIMNRENYNNNNKHFGYIETFLLRWISVGFLVFVLAIALTYELWPLLRSLSF